MKPLTAILCLGLGATLAGPATAVPSGGTQIECYSDVHDGCYLTKPHCTPDEYEGFLDDCDALVDAGSIDKAPPRPGVAYTHGTGLPRMVALQLKRKLVRKYRTRATFGN